LAPVSELTYLDHAATTPLRPEVAEAMAAVHAEPLGNPTGSHPAAQRARRLLEEARDEIADFVGCQPGEVVITSGGTEAANLALFGTLAAHPSVESGPPHLVLHSAVEHPAVIECCAALSRRGTAEVRVVPVDAAGVIDVGALALALAGGPLLVALMTANNETGVVQPLSQVAELGCELSPRTLLFTDAVQAAPFLNLPEVAAGADLIALSAHKAGGPVGTGALVVRQPATVAAHLHGGGQERERRSGTQNVAGAVGMALAFRLAAAERAERSAAVVRWRDRLAEGLVAGVSGAHRTVPVGTPVLPGHLHLTFEDIEREELLVALGRHGICASGGSSCASGALQPSHVLTAMGVPEAWARGAIRFSLGSQTTEVDIERALTVVPEVVTALRRGV
jgi:cysteine desulfurase